MQGMAFSDRLIGAIREKQTPLVVGIDPRLAQLPPQLRKGGGSPAGDAAAVRDFCCGIIDVVAALVPAVKPQVAFFEQLGPHGMVALGAVLEHCRKRKLIVILDGKRGDIGTTARAYAEGWLGPTQFSAWGADALTVNPWLGRDTLAPFVDVAAERNAGLFVLVRTSNPGSGDFQSPVADGRPVFEHVAEAVGQLARETAGTCGYGSVGAVVGATWPAELRRLRELMPGTLFLVPGFGAQGGTAMDVAGAFDAEGLGAVVNSSRGIIFGWEHPDRESLAGAHWQEAVELAAREAIEQLREATPARELVRNP